MMLIIICSFVNCLPNFINAKQSSQITSLTRTINTQSGNINYSNVFDGFENVTIAVTGNVTEFEGTKSFNLADYCELDLISDSNLTSSIKIDVKYNYKYDKDAKIVILTANLINYNGDSIIDTMYGAPYIDESGNFDAVFNCDDGTYILLSELQDADMLENCGWFKNICKKVKNTVKQTANVVGKFVHNNASSLVPLAIGIIGGLTGGAIIPVLVAGTVAGATISGAQTTYNTYKATGQVNWKTTAISTGIGAAVGLVATYTGYGIGSSLNPYLNNAGNNNAATKNKQYKSYKEFINDNGSANNCSIKYGNAGSKGSYEWHHIVEQNQISNNISATDIYSSNNTISLGYDTHRQISNIYSTNIENLSKYKITGLDQLFMNVPNGQTVRTYLSTLSFEQQYEIGIKILKLLGVNI